MPRWYGYSALVLIIITSVVADFVVKGIWSIVVSVLGYGAAIWLAYEYNKRWRAYHGR